MKSSSSPVHHYTAAGSVNVQAHVSHLVLHAVSCFPATCDWGQMPIPFALNTIIGIAF